MIKYTDFTGSQLIRTLLVNNALLIIQYAVSGLIPLVLIPHLVKTIGLASYGDIAIGLSWANYASIVVQYAFHLTGPRYLAQSGRINPEPNVFWDIFAVKLLLFTLVSIAAIIYSVCFPGGTLTVSFLAIYALLPLGATLHSGWYLQALGHFFIVALISSIAAAASLIVGFMLVQNSLHTGYAATSLVIGQLLSGVGVFCVSVLITGRASYKRSYRNLWTYVQDGWSVFLSQFIASLYTFSGPIIIGRLLDSSSAGAYSAVERIITAISNVCLLTHTAAYPKLAGLYASDRASYGRLMKAVLCVYLSLAAICCLVIVCCGSYISDYIFGRYVVGAEVYNYSMLMWWGGVLILLAVFGPLITGYYVVSGQQEKVYPLTIKVLLISFALGIPGVRYFGVWAWFGSLAIAQSIILWTGIQIVRKRSCVGAP